jgi:hypothetical protein
MNKELLDWIEETYNTYLKTWGDNFDDENFKSENGEYSEMHESDPNPIYVAYNKKEFIWQIKFDNKFAERWGIKVFKHELSLDERKEFHPNKEKYEDINGCTWSSEMGLDTSDDELKKNVLDEFNLLNLPKQLVFLQYIDNKEKYIMIYE